jgi:hypothetical protein
MLADSSATGTFAQSASETDDHGTCVVHGETQTNVEGRDTDAAFVGIDVNPQQGTYHLSFSWLPLEGTGRQRRIWNVKGDGCGKFNKPRDDDRWTKQGISPVPVTTVRGALDVNQPTVLTGSHVFERPEPSYDAKRTATLKWDLRRCRID